MKVHPTPPTPLVSSSATSGSLSPDHNSFPHTTHQTLTCYSFQYSLRMAWRTPFYLPPRLPSPLPQSLSPQGWSHCPHRCYPQRSCCSHPPPQGSCCPHPPPQGSCCPHPPPSISSVVSACDLPPTAVVSDKAAGKYFIIAHSLQCPATFCDWLELPKFLEN